MKKRDGPTGNMEKSLVMWTENQIQKCTLLRPLPIQAKARSLFNPLKEHADDPTHANVHRKSYVAPILQESP